MRNVMLGVLVAAVIIGGCRKEGADKPPEPPVIVVIVDAGADADYVEPTDTPAGGYSVPDCNAACVNLRKLGCEDGYRRPGEDTCYIVCKRAQTSGVMDFKPKCVASKTTIEGVRSCGTYRCLH